MSLEERTRIDRTEWTSDVGVQLNDLHQKISCRNDDGAPLHRAYPSNHIQPVYRISSSARTDRSTRANPAALQLSKSPLGDRIHVALHPKKKKFYTFGCLSMRSLASSFFSSIDDCPHTATCSRVLGEILLPATTRPHTPTHRSISHRLPYPGPGLWPNSFSRSSCCILSSVSLYWFRCREYLSRLLLTLSNSTITSSSVRFVPWSSTMTIPSCSRNAFRCLLTSSVSFFSASSCCRANASSSRKRAFSACRLPSKLEVDVGE